MKFFVILEVLFIAARVSVSFFTDKIPAAAITALTWACVVCGVIAGVFVGVEIYKQISGKGK